MKFEYSLVSPTYLKSILLSKYSFPSDVEVTYIYQGLSDTYEVSASDKKYILRIYRCNWKPYNDIVGELAFINLLKLKQVAVSYPIPDNAKNLINQIDCPEGKRYFILFTYAEGKPLAFLDNETAALFGEHLAKIHNASENLQLENLSKNYKITDILSFARKSLENRKLNNNTALRVLLEIEKRIQLKLSFRVLDKLSVGICHGDPHFENCFVHQKINMLTFFDFDFCGNGYFLYDLGSFFHYEKDNGDNKSSFLEGYKRIRPLSKNEIDIVPYFEILMRLFHLGARVNNANGINNPLWRIVQIEDTIQQIYNQTIALD